MESQLNDPGSERVRGLSFIIGAQRITVVDGDTDQGPPPVAGPGPGGPIRIDLQLGGTDIRALHELSEHMSQAVADGQDVVIHVTKPRA
jgi:hypothetical protein